MHHPVRVPHRRAGGDLSHGARRQRARVLRPADHPATDLQERVRSVGPITTPDFFVIRRDGAALESIKWLGMASGTLIILAGTYDLRALIGLNPQLDRRTMPVHFPRYRADVIDDRDAFINVIRKFEAHLPDRSADLVDDWQLLYDASNGCIGSLKLRLRRGLALAIAAGRPMSIADLRPSKFDQARLAAHLADIQRGEHDFSTGAPEDLSVSGVGVEPQGQPEPPVTDRSRPRKPFKRSPKRDRTGSIGSDDAASDAS